MGKELTMYQRAALEGEVAEILKGATGEASALYRIYGTVKSVPTDIGGHIIEVAKELLTVNESKLDRVLLEIALNEFPEHLWLDCMVENIRVALATCFAEQAPVNVPINKMAAKRSLVKSAFIRYMRSAAVTSKEMALKGCQRVLEEIDLDFLHQACFILYREIEEIEEREAPSVEELHDLFDLTIDCKLGLLSYVEETKVLDKLKMLEENPALFVRELEKDFIKKPSTKPTVIKIKGSIGGHPVEDKIELIEKLRERINSVLEETKKEEVYQVTKTFKSSKLTNVVKEFKTKEEAENFLASMEKEYPELLSTCEFKINKVKKESIW